jgi:predicted Zn-dependent peptidase
MEKPQNSIRITSIQVFCSVGSAMENDDMRGISHLIEHMVFKGTKKLPSSKHIFKIYDDIGAYINATTEKSYTNYEVKCPDNYVKECIMGLSDMVLNSVFPPSEFEKEKKVVIEENIRLEDDHNSRIEDMYDSSVYKGSPYEKPIDTLAYHGPNTLQYNQAVQLYKKFYVPNNMVLSVITHLPFSKIMSILEHSDFVLTSTASTTDCLSTLSSYYVPQTEPQYIITKRKELNTTRVIVGFRTCSQYVPDKYALNVLSNLLGGYMGSRLFTVLREENGLTYSSFCDTCYYSILGDFSIFAETDPKKLLLNGSKKGVLPLLINIIHDLQKNGVGQRELDIAKNNLRGSFALEEESNENACFYNGSKVLLYGENKSITPYSKRYDTHYKNITTRDIHNVVKRYLVKANMTVCILGERVPGIQSIKKICEIID